MNDIRLELERIYRDYSQSVFRFLLCLSGNDSQLSEELLQETFLRAIYSSGRYKGKCSVYTWLCAIAKNTYYSYIKNNKSVNDNIDDYENALTQSGNWEDGVISRLELDDVYEMLEGMGEMGEIMLMHIRDGLSYDEIAKMKKKSKVWARVNCARARKKIRERIGDRS